MAAVEAVRQGPTLNGSHDAGDGAAKGLTDHPLADPPTSPPAALTTSAKAGSDTLKGLGVSSSPSTDTFYSDGVALQPSISLASEASTIDASNPFGSSTGIHHPPADYDLGSGRSTSNGSISKDYGSSGSRRDGAYSSASDLSASEGPYYQHSAHPSTSHAESTDQLTQPGGQADASARTANGYYEVGGTGASSSSSSGGALGRFSSLRKSVRQQAPPPRGPLTEDEREAHAVSANLERWAAAERHRRRAARASRVGSQVMPADSKAPLGQQVNTTLGRSASNSLLHSSAGRDSISSFDSAQEGSASGGNGVLSPNGMTSPRDFKGKGKATDDPFSDAAAEREGGKAERRRSYNKPRPSATNPIVTVGGAPKVRKHLAPSIGPDGRPLPSIVSTDLTQGANGGYDINLGSYGSGKGSGRATSTIEEDVEGEDRQAAASADAAAAAAAKKKAVSQRQIGEVVAPPLRKSTSESRFNEVDLEDEEEGTEGQRTPDANPGSSLGDGQQGLRQNGGLRMNGSGLYGSVHASQSADDMHSRPAGAHEEGRRVAWWSEWLCCLSGPPPDDEQTGRTNPLE